MQPELQERANNIRNIAWQAQQQMDAVKQTPQYRGDIYVNGLVNETCYQIDIVETFFLGKLRKHDRLPAEDIQDVTRAEIWIDTKVLPKVGHIVRKVLQ
jgi:hypothetical protein